MKKSLLLLLLILLGCNQKKAFDSRWTEETAPAAFTARFETTKGNIDVAIRRRYSPEAVDRLYQLLRHHYFDDGVFYRVVPGFVAQFGNSGAAAMQGWKSKKVADEKVVLSNLRGTLSFARSGPQTRDLELFFNLTDNTQLDTLEFEGVSGFPALGEISSGIEVAESLYSGYGEHTMDKMELLYQDRERFLKTFPELDFIIKAYVLEP